MDNKLELKHIAPYLPYKLKAVDYFDGIKLIREVVPSNIMAFVDCDTSAKPILRPLSDRTKEIEIDGCKFTPNNLLNERFRQRSKDLIPYKYIHSNLELEVQTENYSQTLDLYDGYLIVNQLFEWHFDVFGLIDKGLAIDINTLNK